MQIEILIGPKRPLQAASSHALGRGLFACGDQPTNRFSNKTAGQFTDENLCSLKFKGWSNK